MLSSIALGLASVSSVVRSILKNVFVPTTPAVRTETFSCTMCESSMTCDGQNEYCMSNYVDTTAPVNGTTSTQTTPEPSLSLYEIIEEGMVQIAEEDTMTWEQSLRAKYGIPQAMENT